MENGINLQVFGMLQEPPKYLKSMRIIKCIPNYFYTSRRSEEIKHEKNKQILKSVYKGQVFGLDHGFSSSFLTVNVHGE